MPKINVSQSNVTQYTSSPLSSKKVLAKPATSMQMFVHYLKGKGEALNLDNLGAKKLIAASILQENAFGRICNFPRINEIKGQDYSVFRTGQSLCRAVVGEA